MFAFPETAQVAGDAAAAMEALDRGGAKAHIQLMSDERMRHAVIMPINFHVVIDAGLGRFPLGVLIRAGRQWFQCRRIDRLERRAARARQFLECPVIEVRQQFPDRRIELGQAEEGATAQPRQNPALDQQHPGFGLGFVLGFVGPRRNDGDPVVGRHLLIGGIEVGLIATGAGDARFEVVRDEDIRQAGQELERPDV